MGVCVCVCAMLYKGDATVHNPLCSPNLGIWKSKFWNLEVPSRLIDTIPSPFFTKVPRSFCITRNTQQCRCLIDQPAGKDPRLWIPTLLTQSIYRKRDETIVDGGAWWRWDWPCCGQLHATSDKSIVEVLVIHLGCDLHLCEIDFPSQYSTCYLTKFDWRKGLNGYLKRQC